ncbi:MAG: HD domain-containing phosphohydrolase [bacterium]
MPRTQSFEARGGYLPIETDLLPANPVKPLQVFVLLGERYVPYPAEGAVLTPDIRLELLERGIGTLYIHETQRPALRECLEEGLESVLRDPSVRPEIKSKVICQTCLDQIEKLWLRPDARTIAECKGVFRHTIDHIVAAGLIGLQEILRMLSYDPSMYAHSVNVGLLGTALAREALSLSSHDLREAGYAMFLHDIGKTRIDRAILNKPGPLSEAEWRIMRRHPEMGHAILRKEGHLSAQASITTLQHHERGDGKGYPLGLKWSEIDPLGRICNLVDSYDALLASRPYKKGLTPFEALKIIRKEMRPGADRALFRQFVRLLLT